MGKSSCVSHPPAQQLVIIREDYLRIVDGNHCAAALLNIFEFWHNVKLNMQVQTEIENEIAESGDAPPVTADLWVYKSIPDLCGELLELFCENSIGKALKLLQKKGFIESRRNPTHRWDKTLQYLFKRDIVQDRIDKLTPLKVPDALKIKHRSRKKKAAIPQTTTHETTTETPLSIESSSLPGTQGRKKKKQREESSRGSFATPESDLESVIASLYTSRTLTLDQAELLRTPGQGEEYSPNEMFDRDAKFKKYVVHVIDEQNKFYHGHVRRDRLVKLIANFGRHRGWHWYDKEHSIYVPSPAVPRKRDLKMDFSDLKASTAYVPPPMVPRKTNDFRYDPSRLKQKARENAAQAPDD